MKIGPRGRSAYAKQWIINDEIWKLKFVNHCGKGNLGLADSDKKTCYIKKGQDKFETLFTFIHEMMLHGAEFAYGLRIPHKVIHQLEVPIAHFILDNFYELVNILVTPSQETKMAKKKPGKKPKKPC